MGLPSLVTAVTVGCVGSGAMSTILILASLLAEPWEFITYNNDTASFNSSEMRVKFFGTKAHQYLEVMVFNYENENNHTFYFSNAISGPWKVCDTLPEKDRRLLNNTHMNYRQCRFYYDDRDFSIAATDSEDMRAQLLRAQKSAMSCFIVAVIVLGSAGLIGTIGLWQKMVPALMVTGVMYMITAVFATFAMILVHLKVFYQNSVSIDGGRGYCMSVQDIDPLKLCPTMHLGRQVTLGWPVGFAWTAIVFSVVACIAWLFTARIMRLEKSQLLQNQW